MNSPKWDGVYGSLTANAVPELSAGRHPDGSWMVMDLIDGRMIRGSSKLGPRKNANLRKRNSVFTSHQAIALKRHWGNIVLPSQAEDNDEEDLNDDSSCYSSPECAPQPGILRTLSPDEEMLLASMLLARLQSAIPSENQVAGIPVAQEPSEFLTGSAESADVDAPLDTVLAALDTASLSSELNSPMESQQAQLKHLVDQQVSD
ncbi:hypothetical protein B0H14DRAFT_2640058, partial [Mycena olivaceomarginata]